VGGLRHDGLDVVIAIAGAEAADDADLFGHSGKFRKCAAERDAGNRSGRFTGHAADAGRSGHFRIERFDLARAAVQEQEDDRLAAQDRTGGRSRGEQVGE
jgi:hypothetical protein